MPRPAGRDTLSCSCGDEVTAFEFSEFVDMPYITAEDVHHIKACFDYLKPVNGVVSKSSIQSHLSSTPEFAQDLVRVLEEHEADLSFSDFFAIMKPKLIKLKNLREGTVDSENTSASVFCLLFPYKKNR